MMENPIHSDHNERTEATKVTRSNDDIESTELDELLKKVPQYEPRINGLINPDFVGVTAKIQYENKMNGERKKAKVGERIVEARQKRITENDKNCAEKAREKVYCGDRNICEEAIERYGDEIIATMKCVAILNSPQTNADHKGQGKLYLTKRKVVSQEPKGKEREKEKTAYRLYYYSYGENPMHRSVERTSDVFGQALEIMEDNTLLKISAGSLIKVSTDDNSHRGAQGVFVSLALDDLISAHHRVSDTTEMRKFVESEASFKKELECCSCECIKYCMLPCIACAKLCSVCTCKIVICRFDAKYWEWMLRAGQNLDSLSQLVSGYSYDHNYNPEQLVYNPLDKTDLVMATTTNTEVHWRRYHTVNFTHMDRDGDNLKHRTVLVMDPHEDTKQGIDLVCHLTALLDSKEHGWNNVAAMHSRDPLAEHGYLLRTNPTATDLLSDAFLGNIDIHIEVSYFYRVNHVWVLILALIGMCVSFAYVSEDPILALNGLYSVVHLLDRVYNFRQKEVNRVTVMKDCAYAAFGLLFTIISGTYVAAYDHGGAAAVAFTFLQGFFAFVGSSYQLYAHFMGRNGTANKPMFETGHMVNISDKV